MEADAGAAEAGSVRDALLRLSAALGCGGEDAWRRELEAARGSATATAIEEVLLQSYLFVGFPVVINALIVWRRLSDAAPAQTRDPDVGERWRAGEALCRRVYGSSYARLRQVIGRLHPDLDRWMIEEGYGKTLSRPGLSADHRELCAVALLAAAGHERQLRAHLRGAAHVGAPGDAIERALEVGCETRRAAGRATAGEVERMRAAWQAVRSGLET